MPSESQKLTPSQASCHRDQNRDKQAAALKVVSGDATTPAWSGRIFDLRVEDHAAPIVEIRRLLTVARAYRLMNAGDEFMTVGDVESAVVAYSQAEEIMPDNHEMVFWHAVTLAGIDQVDESLPLFARAFSMWPKWRELVTRLAASGLLPDDPALMKRILEATE